MCVEIWEDGQTDVQAAAAQGRLGLPTAGGGQATLKGKQRAGRDLDERHQQGRQLDELDAHRAAAGGGGALNRTGPANTPIVLCVTRCLTNTTHTPPQTPESIFVNTQSGSGTKPPTDQPGPHSERRRSMCLCFKTNSGVAVVTQEEDIFWQLASDQRSFKTWRETKGP